VENGRGIADEEQEDLLVRRTMFSVLAAVVACMGIWFLVTTVGSDVMLSVNGYRDASAVLHTVKLMEVDTSADAAVEETVEKVAVQARRERWMGEEDFHCLRVGGGRIALCLGEFTNADAPELSLLLDKVRNFRDGDEELFPRAEVISYPK
jgi:hypothetical protein